MDYLLLSHQKLRLCFCHTCAVFLGKQGCDMMWTEAWKSRYHFFWWALKGRTWGNPIFVAVFMDIYWPITTCLRWVFCDLKPKESQLLRSGRWSLHGWMFYTQGSRGVSLRKMISMRSGSQLKSQQRANIQEPHGIAETEKPSENWNHSKENGVQQGQKGLPRITEWCQMKLFSCLWLGGRERCGREWEEISLCAKLYTGIANVSSAR